MLETVTFASDGLNLSGVVHLPDDCRPGERRPAIIMMHGFGANKNGGPEWVCRQFAAWGYVALRFDYRGCGETEQAHHDRERSHHDQRDLGRLARCDRRRHGIETRHHMR